VCEFSEGFECAVSKVGEAARLIEHFEECFDGFGVGFLPLGEGFCGCEADASVVVFCDELCDAFLEIGVVCLDVQQCLDCGASDFACVVAEQRHNGWHEWPGLGAELREGAQDGCAHAIFFMCEECAKVRKNAFGAK
jgi:hypothetical protein